jgi:hypothetical protein
MKLIVLLALLLPLQSFAWLNCGSSSGASPAAHQHCQDSQGATQTGDLAQHHPCGNCCVTAVAATPLRFTPSSFTYPPLSLPVHRSWRKVALDRLDRPPRLVFG